MGRLGEGPLPAGYVRAGEDTRRYGARSVNDLCACALRPDTNRARVSGNAALLEDRECLRADGNRSAEADVRCVLNERHYLRKRCGGNSLC